MGYTNTTTAKKEKLEAAVVALAEAKRRVDDLALPTLNYIIKMALLEAAEQFDQLH